MGFIARVLGLSIGRQEAHAVTVVSMNLRSIAPPGGQPLPGMEAAAAGTTLEEYGRRWIRERLTTKGTPLAPRTRELYLDELRLHIDPTFGSLDLAAITAPDVRSWSQHMRSSKGPGASTAAKCYRLLKSIMATAVDDGLIDVSPCRVRGGGKEPTSEREIPSVVDLFALAEAVDPRLRCLTLTAAFLGLRKGELLGLRRGDIDLEQLEVSVTRSRSQLKSGQMLIGPTKTEKSRRIVTIPRVLGPELRTHLATYAQPTDEGWVFTGHKGGPLGNSWFSTQWKEAREYVGLPDLHLNDLRHLAGTLAAMTGATTREVMERLGHTTLETAMRYQHATRERNRVLADALDDLIVSSLPEERRRYVEVKYG